MPKATPLERFVTKFDVDPDTGCWVWNAGTTRGGYGKFKVSGHTLVAHRWYYQQTVARLPDDIQLDHLCRNTGCVNPAHLEPVTCRENLLRGDTLQASNAAKTHCPQGHPLSGANLMMDGPRRACRTCKRAQAAAWREANLEARRRTDREAKRRQRQRERPQ